ncbi:MAG: hypothetical protein NTZ56_16460 [Acidobacteria bacterium]|nr:hypothetical protein [Acidobacteriota bacterium]
MILLLAALSIATEFVRLDFAYTAPLREETVREEARQRRFPGELLLRVPQPEDTSGLPVLVLRRTCPSLEDCQRLARIRLVNGGIRVESAVWSTDGHLSTRPGPIVVTNLYYPKPGQKDAVHRQRLLASSVRAKIGLDAGVVLKRLTASNILPEVLWWAEYPDQAARSTDVAASTASAEFEAVRQKMGTLLDHFERVVWAPALETR